MHYYCHPESSNIWMDQQNMVCFGGSMGDGLVEEIDRDDYLRRRAAGWTESNLRLIVAGTRTFMEPTYIRRQIETFVEGRHIDFGLSGMAIGPDRYAYEWFVISGHRCARFEVTKERWEKIGKAAGIMRNREMAEIGTHLLAFWNMTSSGTANMIEEANNKGLIVEVRRHL